MDFEHAALIAQLDELSRSADPLNFFTIVAPDGRVHTGQKRLIEYVASGLETYARTPNKGGKTLPGGALAVSLAQGRPELCGIKLPIIKPSVGAILSRGWQDQIEASQAAVLAMLGGWPYKPYQNRQVPQALTLILVKPIGGSDDEKTWSRIWFHVNRIPGSRLDWIWADEPPDMEAWREARNRSKANRIFLSWITATPIKRPEWEPLKRDFEFAQGHPVAGRIEIRWGLRDNVFLSEEDIQRQYEKNRGDPEAAARLEGEYVDSSGQCPFPAEMLDRVRQGCRDPEFITKQIFTEQESRDGRYSFPVYATYEQYYPIEEDELYYLDIDPALGIRDPDHDPTGTHLYSLIKPRLVCRFHDYLQPYATGWLGGLICKDVRMSEAAYLDCEMNRYGETVIRGARDAGHEKFMFEMHEDRITGQISDRIGWTTGPTNRGVMIGGVQRILQDQSVIIRSRGWVDSLAAVRIQPSGKEEGDGDEDMILSGRFAHIAPLLGTQVAPLPRGFRGVIERELGRRIELPDDQVPDEIFEQDWGPTPI